MWPILAAGMLAGARLTSAGDAAQRQDAKAQGRLQAIHAEETLEVGGRTRSAIVFVPPHAQPGVRRPLILALHGGGTNGASMERFSGLDDLARDQGVIVAYPNGSGRTNAILTWNSGACCGYAHATGSDDVGFMRALVDAIISRHNVDDSRVFATGMSNGAMMAYRLAVEMPDRIAAIAAVSGTMDVDPSLARAPMPVLHVHGTADEHAPYAGGHGSRSAPGNVHTSVDATISAWVRANGASPAPVSERLPDSADDGTTVTRLAYRTADDPARVVLYRIEGGGHTWPGRPRLEALLGRATRDISANDIIWTFFREHRGPASPVRSRR